MHWDYIIVGAGSAGCAAAHELVKNGQTVLLLEAGGSDRSPTLRIPAGTWRLGAGHDWGYRSQPDPTRHGLVESWYRGRVLGGTSSINGMVYVRGAAGDFDRWAQHCGHQGGWSAREIMPIFRDFESSDQMNPCRGRTGPLYVKTIKKPHAVTDAFIESACAAGQRFNADYNGASQEGVGYLQLTQHRGLRWSAADAFIRPIRRRHNLQLRLNALVEKVQVVDGRARGVIFQHKGRRCTETAREIILCAGAVNTPKLLMLSGIGDAQELRRLGIDVVLDQPAVGANLKEHAITSLSYRSKIPTYNLTEGMSQKLAIAAKYLLEREGPVAAAYEAAAFLKTVPSAAIPEVQVFFAPIGWAKTDGQWHLATYPAFKICVIRSHSVSTGRIRLDSADPLAPPIIECRLLDDAADTDTLVRGLQSVRSIMSKRPVADIVQEEIAPGPHVGSMDALREYVRSHTSKTCHPLGTCKMGLNGDAVVGPDLRVHGIDNLWVADASIMPDAISANLNAPCMMIGAKLGKQMAARSKQ